MLHAFHVMLDCVRGAILAALRRRLRHRRGGERRRRRRRPAAAGGASDADLSASRAERRRHERRRRRPRPTCSRSTPAPFRRRAAHPSALVYLPRGFDPTPPLSVIVFIHGFANCVENVVRDAGGECAPDGGTRAAYSLDRAARGDRARTRSCSCPRSTTTSRPARPATLGTAGGFKALARRDARRSRGPAARRQRRRRRHAHRRVALGRLSSGGAASRPKAAFPSTRSICFDSLYGNTADFDAWAHGRRRRQALRRRLHARRRHARQLAGDGDARASVGARRRSSSTIARPTRSPTRSTRTSSSSSCRASRTTASPPTTSASSSAPAFWRRRSSRASIAARVAAEAKSRDPVDRRARGVARGARAASRRAARVSRRCRAVGADRAAGMGRVQRGAPGERDRPPHAGRHVARARAQPRVPRALAGAVAGRGRSGAPARRRRLPRRLARRALRARAAAQVPADRGALRAGAAGARFASALSRACTRPTTTTSSS